MGPQRKKTCPRRFANFKGAGQHSHSRRLISAFIIHFLESTISKIASLKRNFNVLASLCSWGDWFESRLQGNPEGMHCRDEAQY